MNEIRVLIVDDHPLFRRGVRLYLDTVEDIRVVGEAEDGDGTLSALADREIDVLLLDLQMPERDGIDVMREIFARGSAVRILVLTSFGTWDRIRAALGVGASGYVLKDADPRELEAAIRAVAAGGSYLDRRATEELLHRVEPEAFAPGSSGREPLSGREMEVLALITRGMGNREIAQTLVVSEKTIKTHVANIMAKLGVKNRTQAALVAMRERLVPGE
ncbi:MAG: response regulator [Bacillota bacterium]